jgi:DNA-binding MarR family transcriptional regulator
MTDDPDLHRALLDLTGFFNRPQADAVLLRCAGSSLDRAVFPLLMRAAAAGTTTVGELADTVGRHHSTVSRQCAVLEGQGLIVRSADGADGRRSVIRVTAKGAEEVGRIAAVRAEGLAVVFADWTDGERKDLTRLLRKLVDGLESLTGTAGRRAATR